MGNANLRLVLAFIAAPLAALLVLWVVVRLALISSPDADPASWTLGYILLFGTVPAAITTVVVGLPAYALLTVVRKLSAAWVFLVAALAGASVLSLVWVRGFGGRLELSVILVGVLMGLGGGGAFWWIARVSQPPPGAA